MPSSDDYTGVQSSPQSPEEGDQSIASRTRYQLARRRTTTTALHTHKRRLRTPTLSRHTDFGSFGIVANLNTDSDYAWSTSQICGTGVFPTAFLSSPSHKTATIKDSNGTVEISGVAQNEGKGFKSTQRQIFRENDANSFYQKAAGDNEGFCQINSRLGGNVDDYLPILEPETLVVSAVNGQVVSLSHKSTYDMFTIDSTPVTFPFSTEMSKLVTARNTAATDVLKMASCRSPSKKAWT